MDVRLDEIVFRNDNGIDLLLTIEAPAGHTVVTDHPVPRQSEYRVQPGVDNCESVRLVARAPEHHGSEDSQKFTVSGSPERAYITRLTTRHVIGSIHGSLAARTEKGAQAA